MRWLVKRSAYPLSMESAKHEIRTVQLPDYRDRRSSAGVGHPIRPVAAREGPQRGAGRPHAKQIAEYQEAFSISVAISYAQKVAKEKQYEENRAKGDAAYAALSDQYLSAVLRYQTARANTGRTSSADLPHGAQGARLSKEAAVIVLKLIDGSGI